MTVVLDQFFGVHRGVFASGLFARLRPSEKDLYLALSYLSERRRSRELFGIKDTDLGQLVGARPRSLCNARKKLRELGLISSFRARGNLYNYTLCDPATGAPYSGDPRDRPPFNPSAADQIIERLGLDRSLPFRRRRRRGIADLDQHGLDGVFS